MRLQVDVQLTPAPQGGAGSAFELRAAFHSSAARLVLFGPSGAGKSLTLQAIAGLAKPSRGRITLGGRVLFDHQAGVDLPARERRLGYLFQDYALFPHLSVEHNIAFGAMPTFARRISAALARRVHETMRALDIDGLRGHLPAALSGGQKQRVAMARALLCEPELLLLDEPFAALDINLRARVRDELDQIQRRFAVPMLLISHELDDVRRFADTLVLIDAGRVTQLAHHDAAAPQRLQRLAEASLRGA